MSLNETATEIDGSEKRSQPLLDVSNLHTYFNTENGTLKAVDGIDLTIEKGEVVAIVGESGSGKTVTSEAVTRLFDSPPGYIPDGSIKFDGTELTDMTEAELRDIRGAEISHIFQNPEGALNPVYTVGWQIREAIRLHRDVTKAEANEIAVELLTQVGLPEASARLTEYPHQLSGGQKQRVMIAMALACEPKLLIADEPTTALDVTIQAQILDLLRQLQSNRQMSILFITHDLGVVAEIADRVLVMYAGKIMEQGPVEEIFENPAHPYTRALLDCLPGTGKLGGIPGKLPEATDIPDGCRYAERCEYAVEECSEGEQPPMHQFENDDHAVSCVHFGNGRDPSRILGSDAETEHNKTERR